MRNGDEEKREIMVGEVALEDEVAFEVEGVAFEEAFEAEEGEGEEEGMVGDGKRKNNFRKKEKQFENPLDQQPTVSLIESLNV